MLQVHPRNKSQRDKEESTKNIHQRKYTQNNINNLKVRVDTVMNRNFFIMLQVKVINRLSSYNSEMEKLSHTHRNRQLRPIRRKCPLYRLQHVVLIISGIHQHNL